MQTVREKLLHKIVFLGFGLSGMAALIYEVVWTRSLSIVMGSSTYALSTMLAAFMGGLSIGGGLGARLSVKSKNVIVLFALAEFGIGIMGILTIPLIKSLTPLYIASFYQFHLSFNAFSFVQFFIAFCIMGIPTTLMGITFPLVVKFMTDKGGDAGQKSGHLYCINTFGAILGAVASGFILIPLIGTRMASLGAASLNTLTALTILILSFEYRKVFGATVSLFVAITVSSIIYGSGVPLFSYYSASRVGDYAKALQVTASIKEQGESVVLYHNEGVNGEVYLARFKTGEHTYANALYNNGKLEGGDERGFALLAMLPYFEHPPQERPMKALNIGLGSGHTLANLAQFPFKSIDSVELSEGMLEVNRKFLNPSLFTDPRIHHIQADGRNYMEVSIEKYDMIVASPSWAVEEASAELLTNEFFKLVSSRLHKTGVFSVWLDYFLMDDDDLYTILRTMHRNFKHVTVWYVDGDNIILTGSNFNHLVKEKEIMQSVLQVRPDLKDQFMVAFDDYNINSIPHGQFNTDDKPILEFHNARHIITGHSKHRVISQKMFRQHG